MFPTGQDESRETNAQALAGRLRALLMRAAADRARELYEAEPPVDARTALEHPHRRRLGRAAHRIRLGAVAPRSQPCLTPVRRSRARREALRVPHSVEPCGRRRAPRH